MIMNEIP